MGTQSLARVLVLCVLCVATSVECMVSDSISHGVLIKKGIEVRTTRVQWDIVMIMEDATPNVVREIREEIDAVDRFLDTLSEVQARHARRSHWQDEIQRLRAHIPVTPSRSRRAIFDFVGKLSRSLFATATLEDIHYLQEKIRENRHAVNGVIHFRKELMTIINVTHQELVQNRQAINKLTTSLSEMKAWIDRLARVVNQQVHGIVIYNQIREKIDLIWHHVDILKDLLNEQSLQRSALEAGRLHERLLPQRILQELITLQDVHSVELIRPIEYYYTFVRIVPLWRGSSMGYRVTIPMVDTNPYLGYELRAFPVPLRNASATVKLHASGIVAVDPRTGGVFNTDQCQGINPLICPPLAVRRHREHMDCTHALILGKDVLEYCAVDVEPMDTDDETIIIQAANEIILVTFGSNVIQRCTTHVTQIQLIRGTYRITWDQGCMLQTEHWTIPGLTTFHTNLHSNHSLWQSLSFPKIHFDDLIEAKLDHGDFKIPDKLADPRVISLKPLLPSLLDMSFDVENSVGASQHESPYFWLTIILIVVCCSGVGGFLVYRRMHSPPKTESSRKSTGSDQRASPYKFRPVYPTLAETNVV